MIKLFKAGSVWANREYLKFFSSFTIGNIGDWFDLFALQIIFARHFDANPMALALLMVVYMAPLALFGAFAGVIADRLNKKNLLIVTDFLSGVLTIGLIFSGNIALSLVLVFIRSSIVSLNGPVQQAALKYIVPEDQLLAASSYNALVFQLCRVTGPLLGGIIVAFYAPV
jgi:MFS transporter, DHA3 family, macrolide efflux protein